MHFCNDSNKNCSFSYASGNSKKPLKLLLSGKLFIIKITPIRLQGLLLR